MIRSSTGKSRTGIRQAPEHVDKLRIDFLRKIKSVLIK
ncbi:hypothetical protein FRUB_02537 [Fimbriiglobus ruber]|uniref:Uncharacterized protein n=1 Tax=Fimbriiglobus ruber TaxID=1908690 RepID=A0A225DWQ9_9BACT|nr:hypothetical protein FRUB_02537 [Fimbriiglobus ruber]